MDAYETPSLAVILCVNKKVPWLKDAIDSVLTQDDRDFEFLIAANNCTDELWLELNEWAGEDSRVWLHRSSIGQLSYNLNFLADCSSADYLVRMDADDLCEPHRLGTLRRALAENPVDVLGSAVVLIDEEGKSIGRMNFPESSKAIAKALLTRTAFCHPSVALRRQFLFDMHGYLGGFVSEDTDLWLRAKKTGASMRNLPDVLLRYRVHTKQSIASRRGYAEVAGHWLREFLLSPSWYNFVGFATASAKALFVRFLPGVSRYKHSVANEMKEL